MRKIEERLSAWLATHCRWLALVCILSTALPAYLLRDVSINNAAEVWLGARNRERQQYNDFLAKYGNEGFVALFLPSLATRKNPMKPMLRRYAHRTDETISLRLSVFVRRMANSEFNVLLDFLEEETRATVVPPATYTITGITPLPSPPSCLTCCASSASSPS